MRVFSCKSGVAALAVVALLAVSAQAAMVTGTTYTYLDANPPHQCCQPVPPSAPDLSLVGGVYGSGWLNNGVAGDQAFLDHDPHPLHATGGYAFSYQIEGDAAWNPGNQASTGGIFAGGDNNDTMTVRFDLGASYSDLTQVTYYGNESGAAGIGVPQQIVVSDGTNQVVDTRWAGRAIGNGPTGRGEYLSATIDISSLSGQFITLTLSQNNYGAGGWMAINEVTFENVGGEIPEPSTLVLLTAGLLGLLAYAWKRRK